MKEQPSIPEMLAHNDSIVADNIVRGYKDDYPKKEISAYKHQARKQRYEFKQALHKGGKAKFDKATQMYVIA